VLSYKETVSLTELTCIKTKLGLSGAELQGDSVSHIVNLHKNEAWIKRGSSL
jgi:hypothetical protein